MNITVKNVITKKGVTCGESLLFKRSPKGGYDGYATGREMNGTHIFFMAPTKRALTGVLKGFHFQNYTFSSANYQKIRIVKAT